MGVIQESGKRPHAQEKASKPPYISPKEIISVFPGAQVRGLVKKNEMAHYLLF